MHDAALVRGIERVGNLPGDRQRSAIGMRRRVAAIAVDDLGERLSIDQLQHQRVNAVMLLQPVDGGDVGMIERGQRTRFALEARQPIGDRIETPAGSIFSATSRPSLRSWAR